MPIELRTGVQNNSYAFKTSRIEKILNAGSLDEAQRMGFFDRVADRFRGGVKREAIRQLYESITSPQGEQQRPVSQLQRFNRLRDFAQPEAQAMFQVECAPPQEAGGEWGFALSIEGSSVYRSPEGMRDTAETSFAEFNAEMRADRLMGQGFKLAAMINEKSEAMIGGRTLEKYTSGALQFVTDNPEVRAFLADNLDNPVFSSANFKGVDAGSTPDTFIARFETPEGEAHTLELNNRSAGNGELRADKLKAALSSDLGYANLRELVSSGFEGPNDRQITTFVDMMIAMPLLGGDADARSDLPKTRQELVDTWRALESTHPEQASRIYQALDDTKVGKTNVLDVMKIKAGMLVRGMIDRLGAEPTDVILQLKDGAALGQSVLADIGRPDPECKHLEAAIKRELGPVLNGCSDERLLELSDAYEQQPELHEASSYILRVMMNTVNDQDLEPGMAELDSFMERTSPIHYGSRALGFIKQEIDNELIRRGMADPPEFGQAPVLSADHPVPERLQRFTELHIAQGLTLDQANRESSRIDARPTLLIDPGRMA
jgi:hypothetical protein